MEKRRRERREESAGWRERLCRCLDVPPDLFSGAGLLEIRGRNAIRVEGCGKIKIYTPERICIVMGKGSVTVTGKRLACTSYRAGSIGIDGFICGVFFEEE